MHEVEVIVMPENSGSQSRSKSFDGVENRTVLISFAVIVGIEMSRERIFRKQ